MPEDHRADAREASITAAGWTCFSLGEAKACFTYAEAERRRCSRFGRGPIPKDYLKPTNCREFNGRVMRELRINDELSVGFGLRLGWV